jgi:hypothetical protein
MRRLEPAGKPPAVPAIHRGLRAHCRDFRLDAAGRQAARKRRRRTNPARNALLAAKSSENDAAILQQCVPDFDAGAL